MIAARLIKCLGRNCHIRETSSNSVLARPQQPSQGTSRAAIKSHLKNQNERAKFNIPGHFPSGKFAALGIWFDARGPANTMASSGQNAKHAAFGYVGPLYVGGLCRPVMSARYVGKGAVGLKCRAHSPGEPGAHDENQLETKNAGSTRHSRQFT